jgi:hypothetical protein
MVELPTDETLPRSWTIDEMQLTGETSLYAVFRHTHSDSEVHIVPYKQLKDDGLRYYHRISRAENGSFSVVYEGTKLEDPQDALTKTLEIIRSMNQ